MHICLLFQMEMTHGVYIYILNYYYWKRTNKNPFYWKILFKKERNFSRQALRFCLKTQFFYYYCVQTLAFFSIGGLLYNKKLLPPNLIINDTHPTQKMVSIYTYSLRCVCIVYRKIWGHDNTLEWLKRKIAKKFGSKFGIVLFFLKKIGEGREGNYYYYSSINYVLILLKRFVCFSLSLSLIGTFSRRSRVTQ